VEQNIRAVFKQALCDRETDPSPVADTGHDHDPLLGGSVDHALTSTLN
jgi:hypothetical protein